MIKILTIAFLLLFFNPCNNLLSQEKLLYQSPPKEIVALIDAPQTPLARIDPHGKWILLLERPNLPSIEEVSQPELRIAGIRINPKTNGSSRSFYFVNMKLLSIDENKIFDIAGLPPNPKIENVSWSPDGRKAAFTITQKNGIELWVLFLENKEVVKLTQPVLNDALSGQAFRWLSDSKSLIYRKIIEGRGIPPKESEIPEGPVVRENIGRKAPAVTYQDLLKNPYDESLFEYYTNSEVEKINLNKETKILGVKNILGSISPSPDGKYILVQIIKKPFSYTVPYELFPQSFEIWDENGKLIKTITDIPLADDIPNGNGSVRKGPRSFTWRSDVPAELYWIEAQDNGDANKPVEIRDRLFCLKSPFTGPTIPGITFKLRFSGILWGNSNLAIVQERWWKNRQMITSAFKPDDHSLEKKIIFDRSYEDIYSDPGNFITASNNYGENILLSSDRDKKLYLTGQGASSDGNIPFLDQFDISTLKSQRLWKSEAPYYEYPLRVLDLEKKIILTSRESETEPSNYFLRNLKNGRITQLTSFSDPYPSLKSVKKELIKYKRKDGIQLSGTLYLPPDYNKNNGPIPVLMWAYPIEFKSADAAGQVKESPYRFIRISSGSPLFFLTQGYAIFDDPGMPIIGEGKTEPNDSYVEQLVASAEAAIDKLVDLGIADRKRIAIGGHSYGAFMTANLLAHSNLFAAGIARSGAYNRTLTPFGFQSEERTIWQAPDTYSKMSPFMYADKLKTPLLLIHGEADNNTGTFPIQSERFYNALKGHGATVRFVLLPSESHGYRARESVLHMSWEMNIWLEKYVKNKK